MKGLDALAVKSDYEIIEGDPFSLVNEQTGFGQMAFVVNKEPLMVDSFHRLTSYGVLGDSEFVYLVQGFDCLTVRSIAGASPTLIQFQARYESPVSNVFAFPVPKAYRSRYRGDGDGPFVPSMLVVSLLDSQIVLYEIIQVGSILQVDPNSKATINMGKYLPCKNWTFSEGFSEPFFTVYDRIYSLRYSEKAEEFIVVPHTSRVPLIWFPSRIITDLQHDTTRNRFYALTEHSTIEIYERRGASLSHVSRFRLKSSSVNAVLNHIVRKEPRVMEKDFRKFVSIAAVPKYRGNWEIVVVAFNKYGDKFFVKETVKGFSLLTIHFNGACCESVHKKEKNYKPVMAYTNGIQLVGAQSSERLKVTAYIGSGYFGARESSDGPPLQFSTCIDGLGKVLDIRTLPLDLHHSCPAVHRLLARNNPGALTRIASNPILGDLVFYRPQEFVVLTSSHIVRVAVSRGAFYLLEGGDNLAGIDRGMAHLISNIHREYGTGITSFFTGFSTLALLQQDVPDVTIGKTIAMRALYAFIHPIWRAKIFSVRKSSAVATKKFLPDFVRIRKSVETVELAVDLRAYKEVGRLVKALRLFFRDTEVEADIQRVVQILRFIRISFPNNPQLFYQNIKIPNAKDLTLRDIVVDPTKVESLLATLFETLSIMRIDNTAIRNKLGRRCSLIITRSALLHYGVCIDMLAVVNSADSSTDAKRSILDKRFPELFANAKDIRSIQQVTAAYLQYGNPVHGFKIGLTFCKESPSGSEDVKKVSELLIRSYRDLTGEVLREVKSLISVLGTLEIQEETTGIVTQDSSKNDEGVLARVRSIAANPHHPPSTGNLRKKRKKKFRISSQNIYRTTN